MKKLKTALATACTMVHRWLVKKTLALTEWIDYRPVAWGFESEAHYHARNDRATECFAAAYGGRWKEVIAGWKERSDGKYDYRCREASDAFLDMMMGDYTPSKEQRLMSVMKSRMSDLSPHHDSKLFKPDAKDKKNA